ncbi:Protein XRP2 [Phytophthora citrophthora]|uniref:Protein XRP2 n=1 Tax=Phytophthora citrophthora TaxID=4793 RepID=A0AAD9LAW9_9STRA|nr:Protein XRP2 [Phytophthora citrophthora]
MCPTHHNILKLKALRRTWQESCQDLHTQVAPVCPKKKSTPCKETVLYTKSSCEELHFILKTALITGLAMGNICHAGPPALGEKAKSKSTPSTAGAKAAPTFGKDPTLKREDFIFSNIQTASFLAKLPGSINGQQFLIEDCHNCDIFLLDHCTSVQIDACVNCRIVVGPCESSVFLRNCKRCTVVCAVQQFRTRDCENVDVYLYSATAPIIETSSGLRFSCFPLTYFSLQQQFRQAKFSPWNNKWSEVGVIFDFTPDHGGWKPLPMRPHESPLAEMMPEEENNGARSLWKMPSWTAEELGMSVDLPQLVVPITSGLCARKEGIPTVFVCFAVVDVSFSLKLIVGTPKEALMIDFVTSIALATKKSDGTRDGSDESTLLIRTRQMQLTGEQAAALFTSNTVLVEKSTETAKTTPGSVMMEFQGAQSYQHVNDTLQGGRFASEAAIRDVIFVSKDTTTALRLSDLVFQQWKPVV